MEFAFFFDVDVDFKEINDLNKNFPSSIMSPLMQINNFNKYFDFLLLTRE